MVFFRGGKYLLLEDELDAIIKEKERKEERGLNGKSRISFLSLASFLKAFARPFFCVGIIYIIYQESNHYYSAVLAPPYLCV
jgi:hypothetical protein